MLDQIDFDVLEGVTEGDELIVRFKPEGSHDLIYLAMMAGAGVLTISSGDQMFFEAVRRTNDWEGDDNRTQTLIVGPRWDRSFFQGRMDRALESLEVKRVS